MKQDKIRLELHGKDKHPSGKPVYAKELMLEGLRQVMQISARDPTKVNEILLLILETLFNSMGFRFAMICLKDKEGCEFRARLTLEEELQCRKSEFAFSANGMKDLFKLPWKATRI